MKSLNEEFFKKIKEVLSHENDSEIIESYIIKAIGPDLDVIYFNGMSPKKMKACIIHFLCMLFIDTNDIEFDLEFEDIKTTIKTARDLIKAIGLKYEDI